MAVDTASQTARSLAQIATRILVLVAGLTVQSNSSDDPINEFKAIRVSENPNYTRLVFDMERQAQFESHALTNPARVFIDLLDTVAIGELEPPSIEGTLVQRVRHGYNRPTVYRVTFDLHHAATHNVFVLPPNGPYGHRVVIDIFEDKPEQDCARNETVASDEGNVLVVVDAGHGGEDPGAVGVGGVLEKHVTLSIANTVAKTLNQYDGFKSVRTRHGDYAISLRGRRELGQQQKAHLFVSVHADSFQRSSAQGASVFMLAKGKADSELAKWLARNENRADISGGVADWINPNCITDESIKQEVVEILGDKQKDATVIASERVGRSVLDSMARVTRIHPKNRVTDSPFAVLRSTSVPSILVETGFLSNPTEAKKLSTKSHQRKVGIAIAEGIRAYFCANPPWRTRIQQDRQICRSQLLTHVVQQSDTLSRIARAYGVTVRDLQRANGLKNDVITVGDVLTIPRLSEG